MVAARARHAGGLARGRGRAREERGTILELTAVLGVGSGTPGFVGDERIERWPRWMRSEELDECSGSRAS